MASVGHLEVCLGLLMLCVTVHIQAQEHLENVENEKVCQGTSHGLTSRGDQEFRYRSYKDLYKNCTHVVGNLEIVFLDETGDSYDLSFLSSIKQVTGYVLIVGVHATYVPLTSLQIIRGKTLFHYSTNGEDYSLFVALNYDKNSKTIGLQELRFTSLQEILAGKILFLNNNQLCLEDAVDWKDINPYVTPPVQFKFNSTDYRRPCDGVVECDPSCYSNITNQRQCWGVGKDMCQKLTQGKACHPSCERRCYGKLPNQCCHQECAGGCSGPLKSDCLACRNFYNEGECVPFCPLRSKYDNTRMMNIPNPDAKFAYGGICVKECPGYLLQDSGACVRSCSEGKHASDGKNCEPCDGPCPRSKTIYGLLCTTCKGTEAPDFLNAANLKNFTDCTTIDGNLRILKNSFREDLHYNIAPLEPHNLTVLKYVREISGFLLIQSDHRGFTDLSFLSSLEIINGRHTDNGQSLSIAATQLKSLELTSLKRIAHGNVNILANLYLCYADTINWTVLFDTAEQKAKIELNKPRNQCIREGEVCDPQCSSAGCWGKGPNKCLNCKSFEYEVEHLCLESCSEQPLLFHAGGNKCKQCHAECADSCSGPNNTQCHSCANMALVGPDGETRCVPECPKSMYSKNKICSPCHRFCEDFGCKGPSEVVGKDGCNSCEIGLRKKQEDINVTCLPPDTDSCEPGYHMITSGSTVTRKICEPCHNNCETCNGPGVVYCEKCKHFRGVDGYCLDVCPQQYTFGDTTLKQCILCHQECRGGCRGPDSIDCLACSNFKIFLNEELIQFNCTAECPDSLPYQVRDSTREDDNRNVCAEESHPDVQAMLRRDREEEKKKIIIMVVPILTSLVLLGVLLALFGYYCHKRAKSKEKTAQLTARMTGFDETEPITPTNAQPDLAKLRLIRESELRKGGIIGSGAFGTVYKGFWIPEGENVKIPVAIKVLQDGTSPNQNKELLEEARVMASVENACCIRILAVCMSAQMMLITQLMPLGCLLDYVRKNKEHIGSKVLLNWCTQIAKGMAYLEDRGIVHRDLAARNVLVQTPTQVKITDFGLAKLLDYNVEEYHAAGGKMPIKWLALECIQHRIFTHKSDVWSFGVTAWELFTYGQKPYDLIRARDVPGLLEKGERLPQPTICTIDVYMIMIKCWMLDAESRPSFKELAEEFAKMARDPGRYLVVEGDVLKKIPDENFRGSDLELVPIDGLELAPGAMGEGDKLMRLPSHSYDKNELIRSVSETADGPEEIVEADDYLQPQAPPLSPRLFFENNNSPPNSMLPSQAVWCSPMKAEKGEEVKVSPWRERNYAHLDAEHARKERQQASLSRGRENSVNSRYSSDPIKFIRSSEDIENLGTQYHYPKPQSTPNAFHQNGGFSVSSPKAQQSKMLHLPVDEDNYLAPLSAAPNSATYTDLIDKGYYQNEKMFEEESEDRETDSMISPSARVGVPAVENPEYFDQEDDDVWETKPVQNGLHLKWPTAHKNGKTAYARGNGHNYYNDFSHPLPSHPLTEDLEEGRGGPGQRLLIRGQLPSESQV